MHWINAIAIFIMIGSGWKIYNDDIIFSFLRFPDSIVIGKWAQYGLQWHFFGMWIFMLNGLAYLCYGIATGRFRRKLFPISIRDVFLTIAEALRFRLRHDDLTHYNAVQFSKHSPGAFLLHVRNRDIHHRAYNARFAGAAEPCHHADRRSGNQGRNDQRRSYHSEGQNGTLTGATRWQSIPAPRRSSGRTRPSIRAF
jgi:hypothetical protein